MTDEYQIGSGMTEGQLKAASWWVRHGVGVHGALYMGLMAVGLALWGYAAWTAFDVWVLSAARERSIVSRLAMNAIDAGVLRNAQPQLLQPGQTIRMSGTDERQDMLATLSNPNAQWWAEFEYRFNLGETQTPARRGFILPQSQQMLTEIGWKGAPAYNAQLTLDKITWHRIQPDEVERDYALFQRRRLSLEVSDAKHDNEVMIGDRRIGRSTFNLRNTSGFGFWSVDLTVVLYSDGSPVAFTALNLRELKPGETRPVAINWFEPLENITRTEVRPSVNILDTDIFLPSERL